MVLVVPYKLPKIADRIPGIDKAAHHHGEEPANYVPEVIGLHVHLTNLMSMLFNVDTAAIQLGAGRLRAYLEALLLGHEGSFCGERLGKLLEFFAHPCGYLILLLGFADLRQYVQLY